MTQMIVYKWMTQVARLAKIGRMDAEAAHNLWPQLQLLDHQHPYEVDENCRIVAFHAESPKLVPYAGECPIEFELWSGVVDGRCEFVADLAEVRSQLADRVKENTGQCEKFEIRRSTFSEMLDVLEAHV